MTNDYRLRDEDLFFKFPNIKWDKKMQDQLGNIATTFQAVAQNPIAQAIVGIIPGGVTVLKAVETGTKLAQATGAISEGTWAKTDPLVGMISMSTGMLKGLGMKETTEAGAGNVSAQIEQFGRMVAPALKNVGAMASGAPPDVASLASVAGLFGSYWDAEVDLERYNQEIAKLEAKLEKTKQRIPPRPENTGRENPEQWNKAVDNYNHALEEYQHEEEKIGRQIAEVNQRIEKEKAKKTAAVANEVALETPQPTNLGGVTPREPAEDISWDPGRDPSAWGRPISLSAEGEARYRNQLHEEIDDELSRRAFMPGRQANSLMPAISQLGQMDNGNIKEFKISKLLEYLQSQLGGFEDAEIPLR